ncbi:MAG TPA: cob(I)yrinic acid a,c-diamide adenosyltransferase [Bacteroidales bacterium]|mgnify:CR=1 FL=1|jgi:cob(I)alamin adenosyltransferase|nr:cob(I)yrinic acid a,c-diamide adenosyltransferase [Bacteroidales bacterium]
MKIYTRNGDDGSTSLTGKTRVPKYHPRIEACGSIDELIAWIGHLLDFRENEVRKEMLLHIQDQLMRCAYLVASEGTIREECMPDPCFLQKIENEIDRMEADLPSLRNFILPGGHAAISGCHIARCVCRRAERSVVKLNSMEAIPEIVLKLLNRLADYLFVLARRLGSDLDIQCVEWKV